jgi:hypothetical protein
MIEKNQLKKDGLIFGRSLQRTYKLAILYSAEHPAADEPIQTAYSSLNAILRRSPQFTFGFFNQRILLNDLLTPDTTLEALASEFYKRGLMGISFSLGLTLRDFRRGLGVISVKPESIEAAGGTTVYLKKNQVEGMRILAADRKDDHKSDTTLGMDIESFMTAQSLMDPKAIAQSVNFHIFMQSAGVGLPPGFQGTPGDILDVAESAIQKAFVAPDGDPKDTTDALSRVLQDLSPDYLLGAMSPERQSAYKGIPAGELAYVLAEDVAVQWAQRRLGSVEGEDGLRVAHEEIIQVLGRALRTTQVAERLLKKINTLVERDELPADVNDRIKHEMEWAGLTPEEQHAQLMHLSAFSEQDFRHLVEYVNQMGKEGLLDRSTEAAGHFLDIVTSLQGKERARALAHLPELIRVLTGLNTLEFVRKVVLQLCNQISEQESQADEEHVQLVAGLVAAAQSVSMFEDFDTPLRIALELDRTRQKDRAAHHNCCTAALDNLLAPAAVQKVIEIALSKNREPGMSRTIASLLRLIENQAAEVVFQMLEDERVASTRSKLLLISRQLGTGSFEAARKRLNDERWYVIRNACYVLGALGDPDAITHLMPAFSHPDPRVKEAALSALMKSNIPERGKALISTLPNLPSHLQESVINELIMQRDPSIIEPLAEFLGDPPPPRLSLMEKSAQALAALADDRSTAVLAGLVTIYSDNMPVKRSLLTAMRNSPHAPTRKMAQELQYS